MDKKRPATGEYSELRRKAEERLTERQKGTPLLSASDVELRHLIHDLSVHEIELEMQKDELLQTTASLEKSQMDLQQALDRYTHLYDFAPVGYLTLARDSKILEANLTVAKLLGVERGLLKGSRFSTYVTEDSLPVFDTLMERVFESYSPGSCQVRLRESGQQGKLSSHGAMRASLKTFNIDAVISDDLNTCHVALSDISRQKEVELDNALLQEELAQAQKMDAIGRLAGGIAHDYNNILAAILGNAELALRKTSTDYPMRENLEAIIKATKRSAELTAQLLGFARKQDVIPKILLLDSAVESALAMLRRLIGENIVVDWQPSDEMDYVMMDPVQIDQILINLCVNARDAIIGNGRITIRTKGIQITLSDCKHGHCCKTPGKYVMLSVEDNGTGIDKGTLPYIYEPFFTTKAHGLGTGLGLSTVYGIVKQNFGFLECTSEPGKGARFVIYLPRYRKLISDDVSLPPEEPVINGKGSILLVEDDAEILGIVKSMLESAGYFLSMRF